MDPAALHQAVWKNNLLELGRLLDCRGNIDLQDKESGWTPLHSALYFGHLRAAVRLLHYDPSTVLLDFKGHTPVDLLSSLSARPTCQHGVGANVYSWGSGANYALGSGVVTRQDLPARVEGLATAGIVSLAAAKFHSAAVGADGRLYTWGHGRGGRLGHPEFGIHGGEAAVIAPRVVDVGRRLVAGVAAAKHHMVAVTACGTVFTWGSNRDGRLGYMGVDTQSTPRRVVSIRLRMIAVAAANRHSACLTDNGQLYTWGSNAAGQLGYGTYDSAFSATPRVVEALKDRRLVAVSAAKRHTVALEQAGDVFTWGHKNVAPRRVALPGTRDISRAVHGVTGTQRVTDVMPRVTMIAAGAAHTSCITDRGIVLAWRSAYAQAGAQEVGGLLSGKVAVHVSAGKYRTAVVTADGNVYMWEGWSKLGDPVMTGKAAQKCNDLHTINAERVNGVKRIIAAAVGEKHSLCLQTWSVPSLDTGSSASPSAAVSPDLHATDPGAVPSLQHMCEAVVAKELVEPRTAAQLYEFADAAGAHMLKGYCEEVVLRNLECIVLEACSALQQLSEHLQEELEMEFVSRLARSTASQQVLVAPFSPAIAPSAAGGSGLDMPLHNRVFQHEREVDEAAAGARLMRQLQKKLQQVEMLERRHIAGDALDAQQHVKIQQRPALEAAAALLSSGRPPQEVMSMLDAKRSPPGALDGQSSGHATAQDSRSRDSGARERRRRSLKLAEKGNSVQADSGARTLTFASTPEDANTSNVPPPETCTLVKGDSSSVPWQVPLSSGAGPVESRGTPGPAARPQAAPADTSASPGSSAWAKYGPQTGFTTPASGKKAAGKAVRKGGLSMFLAGELERPPRTPTPPPAPTTPAPSWRAAPSAAPRVSLLSIQSEEAAAALGAAGSGPNPARPPAQPPARVSSPSLLGPSPEPSLRVAVADLVSSKRSAPIPLVRQEAAPAAAWGGASGASPPGAGPQQSLRVIQAEQEEGQVAGGSWGKLPGSYNAREMFRHMSSWRERRTAVTAAVGSPSGGMQALGSSPPFRSQ